MRLQVRLAITVASAAAIAILLMATGFWVLSARQQRDSIDRSLINAASAPRQLLDDSGIRQDGDRRRGDDSGRFGGVFETSADADRRLFTIVRFTNRNGVVVVDQGLPGRELESRIEPELETIEIDGDRYRMATVAVGTNRDGGLLQIARNIEDTEEGLSRLRRQILVGSLLGIGLAGGLGALVARRLSSPIAEVAAAARTMSLPGELPEPIDVSRRDEVGDLARSFNQMLAALELSRNQQRRLVADASHELRTPLTSLRLKIDLLDSTPDLPEVQQRDLLTSSALEIEQLSDLVTELVDLATDPTGVEEPPASHSLAQLVNDVSTRTELRSGRPISVVATTDQRDVVIRVRMVRRAVSNLLDNAIKYSPPGSAITVTIDGDRIEIRDEGEGIPEADLPYVFDRFFRSPTARTRPGNGIGLAIVKRVADVHDGTTWARNAVNGPGAIVGFSVGGHKSE